MTAIYQLVKRVLVCLGETRNLAIETLEKLGGADKQFSITKAPGVLLVGPHLSNFRFSGHLSTGLN